MTGFIISLGAVLSQLVLAASALASAVYLSYGLSRLVSLAVDGRPYEARLTAGMVELVIGVVSLFVLPRRRTAE